MMYAIGVIDNVTGLQKGCSLQFIECHSIAIRWFDQQTTFNRPCTAPKPTYCVVSSITGVWPELLESAGISPTRRCKNSCHQRTWRYVARTSCSPVDPPPLPYHPLTRHAGSRCLAHSNNRLKARQSDITAIKRSRRATQLRLSQFSLCGVR
jgi:hypothetical protein